MELKNIQLTGNCLTTDIIKDFKIIGRIIFKNGEFEIIPEQLFEKKDNIKSLLKMNILFKLNLDEILFLRDQCFIDSKEWIFFNDLKKTKLEILKPGTKETIITFFEKDLSFITENFDKNIFDLNLLPIGIESRSYLEYHPSYRHPIPYVIVKNKDKYFFILREKGSGEIRLIGKKGLLGGHVGFIPGLTIGEMIEDEMKRELYEEAGIKNTMIDNISFKGFIKSNEGVDSDHLGLIYEIELNVDNIKSEEIGVLSGIWIDKKDLENHYNSFESWSKIVYNNIIKE